MKTGRSSKKATTISLLLAGALGLSMVGSVGALASVRDGGFLVKAMSEGGEAQGGHEAISGIGAKGAGSPGGGTTNPGGGTTNPGGEVPLPAAAVLSFTMDSGKNCTVPTLNLSPGSGGATATNSATGESKAIVDGPNEFPTEGKAQWTVKGKISSIFTQGYSPERNNCLISVDKWENTDTQKASFAYSPNLISVATPPTTITDMSSMFAGNYSYNQDISGWDTSNVKNMDQMFANAQAFNKPIGEWNVANVENMNEMFQAAGAFNQDLSKWNTGKVKKMSYMFKSARTFNQPIENWNTSSVEDMGSMFDSARNFNQPLGKWDTSKVSVMTNMFVSARSFNQDLHEWKPCLIKEAPLNFGTFTSPERSPQWGVCS